MEQTPFFLTTEDRLSEEAGDEGTHRIMADYDQYPGARANRREVEVGTWSSESFTEDTLLGKEILIRLRYQDLDEGYENDPEFQFVLTRNEELVWETTVRMEENADEPTPVMAGVELGQPLEMAAGDVLSLTVHYTGWEDCDIYLGGGDQRSFVFLPSSSYGLGVSGLSVGEHTILFGVRDDNGAWSQNASITLTVNAPGVSNKLPTVIITSPENGSKVKGTITIEGTATDEDGAVEKVEISINGGEWIVVTGIDSWDYEWDSNTVKNGDYVIKVRAFDGEDYSDEIVWNVKVDNEKDDDDGPGFELIAVVLGILVVVWWRKR